MPRGYRTLQLTYAVTLILIGADKLFHLLVDWNRYLAPLIRRRLPVPADTFMDGVGVVQVLIGILILVRPRAGALAAGAILLALVVNYLLIPGYFDIAARDLALAAGAFALARMSAPPRVTPAP